MVVSKIVTVDRHNPRDTNAPAMAMMTCKVSVPSQVSSLTAPSGRHIRDGTLVITLVVGVDSKVKSTREKQRQRV